MTSPEPPDEKQETFERAMRPLRICRWRMVDDVWVREHAENAQAAHLREVRAAFRRGQESELAVAAEYLRVHFGRRSLVAENILRLPLEEEKP